MLNFLPHPLLGAIAATALAINVIIWTSLLFMFALVKFMLPIAWVRSKLDWVLLRLAENWIACNGLWMALTQKAYWDVEGLEHLNSQGWYLVVSNHQSWADIFILQKLLNRRIPLMKFFIKRELIWVPLMGLAWWALDFPFLRRHSPDYLNAYPEQRGRDFETTRKACAKFTRIPTSVMNFLEGTRYTKGKHARQNSPYRHLLKPKAGGIALALGVLGEQFNSLLNITIVYPDGSPTFWDFLCGRVKRIVVRLSADEIPPEFLNRDYEEDPVFKAEFQEWVVELWQQKDGQINDLLEAANGS